MAPWETQAKPARFAETHCMDEDAFLAELLPRLGRDIPVPPGDDCAAIPWRDGELLLLATDQVAADVHYYGPDAAMPTPPELAGRKLLARNLSDIAAMAGRPTFALLTLAAPCDVDAGWLRRFTDGVLALAAEHEVALIGGDVSSAGDHVATLTILGTVAADRVCRRDAAQAGDRVVVTGALGGSFASGRHLSFEPRLAEARWLAEQGVRCLIDISDGLLTDLQRICAASALQARIEEAAIPRHTGCDLAQALADGEDYELLAAVPADTWDELHAAWPFAAGLTAIGRFQPTGDGPGIRSSDGADLASRAGPGFRHFA